MSAGLALAVSFQPSEMVRICKESCVNLTAEEYRRMKAEIVQIAKGGAPLDGRDWEAFVAILDAEIRKSGGARFQNVASQEELKAAIIKFLSED